MTIYFYFFYYTLSSLQTSNMCGIAITIRDKSKSQLSLSVTLMKPFNEIKLSLFKVEFAVDNSNVIIIAWTIQKV